MRASWSPQPSRSSQPAVVRAAHRRTAGTTRRAAGTTRRSRERRSRTRRSFGREEASDEGPLVQGTWGGGCNQYSVGDLRRLQGDPRQEASRAIGAATTSTSRSSSRTRSAAHVTVHFNPIYTLKNAGLHGDGITSTQDVGLDPGERREYAAKQEPKGVKGRPKITKCAPTIDTPLGRRTGLGSSASSRRPRARSVFRPDRAGHRPDLVEREPLEPVASVGLGRLRLVADPAASPAARLASLTLLSPGGAGRQLVVVTAGAAGHRPRGLDHRRHRPP